MECKFINHGIALSYDQLLKPCCNWTISDNWRANHHLSQVNIVNWHQHTDIVATKEKLLNNQWPNGCARCERVENQGRGSIRGDGNNAYADYKNDDITLEIRPGSVCNFACQTCWPEASSRVAQYHHQAGMIDIKNLNSNRLENFDFLLPVAHRIRNVILLGGEPFYDKSCKKFLNWAIQHLGHAKLTMFTNGSVVDIDFLKRYPEKITLVFSIDAVGKPAEYIRHGTVWKDVFENYQLVKTLPNVELRVNITSSIYNYFYISDIIELLCQDWPTVVSFGVPTLAYHTERAVPLVFRSAIIDKLSTSIELVQKTNIESGQKSNAINSIRSIINNLQTQEFDHVEFEKLQNIVNKLDSVKNLYVKDYCNFLADMLQQKIT